MTRPGLLLAALLALLLAAAAGAGIWLGREGPLKRTASPDAVATGEKTESPGTVTVSRDAQQRSGIATEAAQRASFHPSITGYATVVDLQPLVALSRRMAAGEADVRSARAAASTTRQELERNRALYADDRNVSSKAVQQAEAADRASEARLESVEADLREARTTADQQYGATLAAWAAQPSSPDFARLASRKRVLVTVALPDALIGNPPRIVHLAAPGYEPAAANLVSASPRSDPLSPGRTYLYLSDVPFPSGLTLDAQIRVGGRAVEGWLVPKSAVIWYGNEAWVFVQQSADQFARRALHAPQSMGNGVFTTTAFAPAERIVTTGAELLHSEELRPKTPAASGCADPECD